MDLNTLPPGIPAPAAAKPTLDQIWALEPDGQETDLLALKASVAGPRWHDVTEQADADTAQLLAGTVPAEEPARSTALDAIRDRIAAEALPVMRAAHAALHKLRQADAHWHETVAHGGARAIAAANERAQAVLREAALACVAAAEAAMRARGADRAVSLARAGGAWTPRDPQAEAAELFGIARDPHP